MQAAVQKPIFFVLGNHDFYYDSISNVRSSLEEFCELHQDLTYLSRASVVELTKTTAIVGHDGWGDARLGNYAESPVRLSDNVLIQDLVGLEYPKLIDQLRTLGG